MCKFIILFLDSLRALLQQFDGDMMKRAALFSFKKNETSSADLKEGAAVPEENVYHLQIVYLLKGWLAGSGWIIDSEFNVNSKSADIVITSLQNERYVLELVAHARDSPATRKGSVQEHFERAEKFYSKIDGRNFGFSMFICFRCERDVDNQFYY